MGKINYSVLGTQIFLESVWFTWVTSMSHLPMEIEDEKQYDWVTLHLKTTQNVASSLFTDWFSGHLNFQVEHHLFPMMPRHNLYLTHDRVKELCKNHGIEFVIKDSLFYAFYSVWDSLFKTAKEFVRAKSKLN